MAVGCQGANRWGDKRKELRQAGDKEALSKERGANYVH